MNHWRQIIASLVFVLSLFVSGCGSGQSVGSTVAPTPTVLPTATPAISVSPIDGMTLVYVPAGEFIMGSNEGDVDEKPMHTVYLDAFWIDKTEVTQGMYAKCTATGCQAPTCSTNKGDNFPVVCINWKSANAYCEWAGRRLLTETEWEKAARGTEGYIYPWGNEPATCEYAVMDDLSGSGNGCGQKSAWEVGSKPKGISPYGALDMAGNVAEWVADWEDRDAAHNAGYVLRGGGYLSIPSTVRASKREMFHWPVDKYEGLGFRCGTSEP